MGRYDSPLSVATLFLVATVVSVGLIFLFDAETESRIEKHSTEISSSTGNTKGIVHNSIASQHHDINNNNNNNNRNNWDRDEHLQSYTDQGIETHTRKKGDEGGVAHVEEDVTAKIPSATHHEGSGSIFSYFGGKIKDLFRRQHRVRKRSLDEDSNSDTDVEFDGVLNSEWSDSEEDEDGPIDPIALPLQELPNQSLKRKAGDKEDEGEVGESDRDKERVVPLPSSTIVKRDANFDSSQNVNSKSHHSEDGNLNVISRNMNTNTNLNQGNGNIFGGESGKSSYPGFGYAPGPGPGPALMSPSPVSSAGSSASSSSSSGFHKIRHAIRKLGGGGLDLSMVERMILDSNPGRFRASSETQDVEHRSNYHVSPPNRNSKNNHNHKNSESRSGFHPPDTHPPYHFPFPEQQSRQQQQQQQAQTHINSRGQEEDERRLSPRERGKEKLHDDTDTSSPGLSNRGNSRGSGGGGGGDGGGHSNSSPFSSRSRGGESSSNRHWKSTDNNHNLSSNDNENDNSFERDRRGSSTSASLLQPRFPFPSTTSASWSISSSYPSSTAVSTFPDALPGSGSGSAGSLGAAVEENSSSHHGRGGSGHSSGPNQSTDSRQANFNSNSNRQKKKLSSLRSLSPALSSLMEDSNPNESTDFHHEKREQDQDVLNGRQRKTNDANSRLEFPTAPRSHPDSASSAFQFENGAAVESQVDFNDERDLESHTNANYHHHDHHHHHQKQQQRHETGDIPSKRKNHGSESSNSMDLINMGGDGVIGIAIDAVRDVHVDREGKQTTHITDTKRSIIKEDVQVCYKTDDVLIVVAITCCLNFAFVLVVWGCVRWFSISSTAKERDFHHLDCEDGGDSILFHEEQDHEEPCWRAPSPMALDFDRPDKFEHGEDCCLEQVTSSKCRGSSRDCISHQHTHHHHHQQQHHVVGQEKCQIMQEQSGRAGARMSPTSCGNPSPSSSPPLFTSSFPMCDEMVVMPRESARSLVSSLRKPSDRFHFFRQKQYQKNLKEFGLGFGPPLSTVSNYSKNISRVGAGVRGGAGGTRLSSASMYSFQTSDVPHHLQHQQQQHQQQQYHHHHDHQSPQQFQLLKNTTNRQKSYSHSMEDLRYIHT